jgi:phage shock protein PspC (stress-responsive transcriptional regulator)
MNKTININLAGLFFHIDEDAYDRLQGYLNAVKRSFEGTTGADEIMSDIESRIAELFLERRKSDQAVVSLVHVEEVIAIMGQPEDYEVDEEIFEEQTRSSKSTSFRTSQKKLYRDTMNGYVGGVATGLAHYLGIEAVWSRVIWAILIVASSGTIIPVYVLLWILVPDAVSTSDRLKMMGKEVNLSNISGSQRNDFNEVAGEEPDASHANIVGQRTKRGSVRFFGSIGKIIKGFFKIVLKFVGLIIFISALAALIGIIVSFLIVGFANVDGLNVIEIADYVIPAEYSSWLLVVAIILAFGIPLFGLAVVGLRILVSNMRSIILPVKLGLLVAWIASVIFITITVIQVAASQSYEASYTEQKQFAVTTSEPLKLDIDNDVDQSITRGVSINRNWLQMVDYKGEAMMSLEKVRTAIVVSQDSVPGVKLKFRARGADYENAKDRAQKIIYNYEMTDSTFTGSNRIILERGTALAEHKLDLVYEIPVGQTFTVNRAFKRNYSSWIADDALPNRLQYDKTYLATENGVECLDCSQTKATENDDEINSNDDEWIYE